MRGWAGGPGTRRCSCRHHTGLRVCSPHGVPTEPAAPPRGRQLVGAPWGDGKTDWRGQEASGDALHLSPGPRSLGSRGLGVPSLLPTDPGPRLPWKKSPRQRHRGEVDPSRKSPGCPGTATRRCLPGQRGVFLSISCVSSETAPDRCREPDLERQGDEVRNTTKTLGVGWGSSFGELLLLSVGLDVLGGCRQQSSPVRACSRPSSVLTEAEGSGVSAGG